jgi:hypothetical protein
MYNFSLSLQCIIKTHLVMYKNILSTFFTFIINPAKAWQDVSNKESGILNSNTYAYILLGLTSLFAFIGSAIHAEDFNWQLGIKEASLLFISLFIGIYLSTFVVRILHEHICKNPISFNTGIEFTIYSFSCIFLINMAGELIRDIFYIQIVALYTIYIVWEGSINYLSVPNNKRTLFVVCTSGTIILSPILIRYLMVLLMPGME